MPWIQWNTQIDGKTHEIKMFHGIISGKKKILVDNTLIFEEETFKDIGADSEFKIGKKSFRIKIWSKFLTWNYLLEELP